MHDVVAVLAADRRKCCFRGNSTEHTYRIREERYRKLCKYSTNKPKLEGGKGVQIVFQTRNLYLYICMDLWCDSHICTTTLTIVFSSVTAPSTVLLVIHMGLSFCGRTSLEGWLASPSKLTVTSLFCIRYSLLRECSPLHAPPISADEGL